MRFLENTVKNTVKAVLCALLKTLEQLNEKTTAGRIVFFKVESIEIVIISMTQRPAAPLSDMLCPSVSHTDAEGVCHYLRLWEQWQHV